MRQKVLFLIISTFITISLTGQDKVTDDHYEHDGQLMTVIICSSLVILAIAAYLLYLEKRVKALEEEYKNESNF